MPSLMSKELPYLLQSSRIKSRDRGISQPTPEIIIQRDIANCNLHDRAPICGRCIRSLIARPLMFWLFLQIADCLLKGHFQIDWFQHHPDSSPFSSVRESRANPGGLQ